MNPQPQLRNAFDEVAGALESYFGGIYGSECGMSCSTFLHAVRDLVTHEDYSDGRVEGHEHLAQHADKMMLQFFMYYLRKRGYLVSPDTPVTPVSTNYPPPYDPGPPKP